MAKSKTQQELDFIKERAKGGVNQSEEAEKFFKRLNQRPPYFTPLMRRKKSLEGQQEFDFSKDALTKEPSPAVGNEASTETPAG